MIKKFNDFMNEGLTDKMIPKTEEEISASILQSVKDGKAIDLSKYNFNDISIESSEIDEICGAIEKELKIITNINEYSLDHIYDTGSPNEDKSTGNLTLEFSTEEDVDREYSDDDSVDMIFIFTYICKQHGINSPYLTIHKE